MDRVWQLSMSFPVLYAMHALHSSASTWLSLPRDLASVVLAPCVLLPWHVDVDELAGLLLVCFENNAFELRHAKLNREVGYIASQVGL